MSTEKKNLSLNNAWNGLSLRIIALFATAMLVSFSPDFLRDFFADEFYQTDKYHHDFIDEKWNWGYRHYLYFYMCIMLFAVQACRLVKWINSKDDNDFKP